MQFIKFLVYALILFNTPSYANENLINKRIEYLKKVMDPSLILKINKTSRL